MTKWCFNYETGEYEYIDKDGFSIDRGEYIYIIGTIANINAKKMTREIIGNYKKRMLFI